MKNKITNNLQYKILALLLAILLWLIVLDINDPSQKATIKNIPVTILNDNLITDNEQVYEITAGAQANVVVEGPKSIVDALDSSDFVAVADFRDLSQTNAIPITISLASDKYESKLIITQETKTMRIDIEEIVSKTYDILVSLTGEAGEGSAVKSYSMDTRQITVTAPQSIIDTISKAVASVNLANATEDFTSSSNIKLINISGDEVEYGNGNVRVDVNKTNVIVDVCKVKTIPLEYSYFGVPANGYMFAGFESEVKSVDLLGEQSVLDEISVIELPATLLTVNYATDNVTAQFNVTPYLPVGTTLYNTDEEIKVTAMIVKSATKIFNINTSNITFDNVLDGYEVIEPSITKIPYTIMASEELLDQYEADAITAKVDTSNKKEGTYELELVFTLPNGYNLVDKVTIEIQIKKKEEEKPTEGQEETTTARTDEPIDE